MEAQTFTWAVCSALLLQMLLDESSSITAGCDGNF